MVESNKTEEVPIPIINVSQTNISLGYLVGDPKYVITPCKLFPEGINKLPFERT